MGNEPLTLRNALSCNAVAIFRADRDELVERAGKRCLVTKSRLNRNVDQRYAGLAHQLFGMVNAMLNQPYVVISYKSAVPSMDTLEQQLPTVPTPSLHAT